MGKLKDRVIIKQDPEAPVEREVLATAIVKISEAIEALKKSGVNEYAVIVLLHDKTGVAKGLLKHIFGALADLKRDYTR